MKVVVLLQNAWSPLYAGKVWPRASWLRALGGSRSGKRLQVLTTAAGDEVDFWFDNATPVVGPNPSSIVPADLRHVADVLHEQCPSWVVACGQSAAGAALSVWDGNLLLVPHPAHRLLTDVLYEDAAVFLRLCLAGRYEFRQLRGQVSVTNLMDNDSNCGRVSHKT